MSKLSRSKFLKTAGAATGAAMISVPAAGAISEQDSELLTETSLMAWEPLVAFVRDAKSSEVTVLVGKHETTYRDPALVKRLLKAAARHSKPGTGQVP